MDRRGFLVDVALGLVFFAGNAFVVTSAVDLPDVRDPDGFAYALLAALSVAVVLRRDRAQLVVTAYESGLVRPGM